MTNLSNDEIIKFLKRLKVKNHDTLVSSIENISVTDKRIQIILNSKYKEKQDIESAMKIWQQELCKFTGVNDCRIISTSHKEMGASSKEVPSVTKPIGEKYKLLKENLEVTVSFMQEKPISIELPNNIECTIETTDAAIKNQTASSSYKPALLDCGIRIDVPPFIESGEKIIIDTRTLEYVKRVS